MGMGSKGCHVSVDGEGDWPSSYHVIEYFNLDIAASAFEPSGELFDCREMIGPDRAFPDNRHPPTHSSKRRNGGGIPFPVPSELVIPEFRSCLGQAEVWAPLVPVPEAAMHKDDRSPFGQDEVRLPGKLPAMKAETVAVPPKQPPDDQFRSGVLGLDP
jgi:hypothetical protein